MKSYRFCLSVLVAISLISGSAVAGNIGKKPRYLTGAKDSGSVMEGDKGGGSGGGAGGGGREKGNGGVDIISRNIHGKRLRIPNVLYVDKFESSFNSICDLVNDRSTRGYGDPKDWRRQINQLVQTMYRILPGAGEMLAQALSETEFHIFWTQPDDRLEFTGDDGNPVDIHKENGAVRLPDSNDVLLLGSAWKEYWDSGDKEFPAAYPLFRSLHEAVIPYAEARSPSRMWKLDRMIAEMMRVSGLLWKKNGRSKSSFENKSGPEIATILNRYGISPGTKIQDVGPDFAVEIKVQTDPGEATAIRFQTWDELDLGKARSYARTSKVMQKWLAKYDHPPVFCSE